MCVLSSLVVCCAVLCIVRVCPSGVLIDHRTVNGHSFYLVPVLLLVLSPARFSPCQISCFPLTRSHTTPPISSTAIPNDHTMTHSLPCVLLQVQYSYALYCSHAMACCCVAAHSSGIALCITHTLHCCSVYVNTTQSEADLSITSLEVEANTL